MAFFQLINMIHKNWTLKQRNKCGTFCELLVPLIVVATLVIGYYSSSPTSFLANNYLDVEVWPSSALVRTSSNITSASMLFDVLSEISDFLTANPKLQTTLSDGSKLETFNMALFTAYGVGLSESILNLSNMDLLQNPQTLETLFNKPLPIIPFDAFVMIQKYLQSRAPDSFRRIFDLVPWVGSIAQVRRLAFAPDTPEVQAMVQRLNETTFFFAEIFCCIFSTEEAAINWATTLGLNQVWAVIIVQQLDALRGQFSYSIRMNQTTVPNTNTKVLKFARGRSNQYQHYIVSGFPTLQHLLDGYFLELSSGQSLGTACPATVPAIVLDRDGEVTTTGNLSWGALSATLLKAVISRLPRNLTNLVPGLVDPQDGSVTSVGWTKLRHAFLSPATTMTLVLPVPDYSGNDFFSFAADFIGMVGVYAYLFPLAVTVRMITQEKETRIKQSMLIMGLSPSCLYWSWLLTNLITATITAVFITIEMKLGFCKYVDFFLLLTLNWLLAVSIVAFAFLCSTLFNKARTATMVAPLLLFALTIPALALPDGTAGGVKLILSVLSPAAYCWGMGIVALYENLQVGMAWRNISQKADDGYTVLFSIGMLAFDAVLYLFVAWYLDQVLPSAFGVRRGPCFCIPSCIRRVFRRRTNARGVESGAHRESESELFETPPPELAPFAAVRMQNLRKEFKSCWRGTTVAVDGLNMTMYENQINVMLGHNGAGKSTTIHMMTGLLAPTAGDCLVYGRSIRADMAAIR
eukprot:EG_transcript_4425